MKTKMPAAPRSAEAKPAYKPGKKKSYGKGLRAPAVAAGMGKAPC